MITQNYLDYIQELFLEGLDKLKAKKKFLHKWSRENIDIAWKDKELARNTFDAQWDGLEKWDKKRLVQEKRKKVLEELAREESQYE